MAQLNLINQLSVDIFEKLSTAAKERNIWTNTQFNQNLAQQTLPVFNPEADKNWVNYFDFRQKFDRYTFTHRISDEAQVNLLKSRAIR